MQNYIKVLKGGNTSSIQDKGRYGYQDKGIPPSGVVNLKNYIIANNLVGNKILSEVIEIFFNGPTLEINIDKISIALIGSLDSFIEIKNKNIKIFSGRSFNFIRGDIIHIHLSKDCLIGTLAISGNIKSDVFLGSKSTNPNIGVGGINGEFLKDGSKLFIDNISISKEKYIQSDYIIPNEIENINVLPNAHENLFDISLIDFFYSNSWTVSRNINRMGIILDGNSYEYNLNKKLLSDGNITGSIQMPSNGNPIILLPDRGTTGGYPKIASIISSDLYKLSYLKPGRKISFKKVNYEYAIKELKKEKIHLNKLLDNIREL